MAATHWEVDGSTLCGRDASDGPRILLLTTADAADVTCKRCLHALNAPEYVGTSRGRKQYKLTAKGGPWDGKEVVLGEQVSGPMSMWIHVGEHVGRYNMNTGVWTPKEMTE